MRVRVFIVIPSQPARQSSDDSDDSAHPLCSNGLRRPLVRRRAGVTLVYAALLMVVFIGFVSLGVDWGRVQVTKTELQVAADAAARAAAAQLSNGVAATQNAAVTWAGYNKADGTSVVINAANDVEFGTWTTGTRTFAVLSGAARSSANAVRITARRTAANGNAIRLTFAPIFGMNTCDAKASATVMVTGNVYGIIGLSSINLNTTGVWDSYVSSVAAYSAGTASSNAIAASNGDLSLNGDTVKGDAHPGIGGSVTGGTGVTGSKSQLTSTLSYTSVSTASYAASNNNASLPGAQFDGTDWGESGASTVTIPGGTYYMRDFKLSGNTVLNMTGPVTICAYGATSISSGTINSYQNLPANFKLRLPSGATFQMRFNTTVYADIYAPDSAISMSGASTLYGRVVGASLQQTGTGSIHQDESLTGGSLTVSTVK